MGTEGAARIKDAMPWRSPRREETHPIHLPHAHLDARTQAQ